MSVDTLLARLDRPRRTGRQSWRAPCPAHGGTNRSALAIRELGDGRVLVHCHAHGCGAAEIVAAVGLELDDLFPERAPSDHRHPRERRPWNPTDILAATAEEAAIAYVIVRRMLDQTVTGNDMERLLVAAERISRAKELANG